MAQPDRDLLLHPATQSAHPNDFTDLHELTARILGFQDLNQETATPFEWKFTTSDLHDLLNRIDQTLAA